jgi:hypothetical protein
MNAAIAIMDNRARGMGQRLGVTRGNVFSLASPPTSVAGFFDVSPRTIMNKTG